MIKWLIPALVLSALSLFGGSVRIYNDSPYHLSARIIAADGSDQGSLSLAPQQQGLWQSSSGGNSAWSLTPYTVILTCKNGKQFGVINGVQQGATVTANSAIGPLFCEKDKKESSSSKGEEDGQSPTYNPNQVPFDPYPNQQGNTPGSADPHSSPGDPIWGPP
ncbi:MAG: hypothetical protein KDK76_05685 [Chlamydiia bacterium]|nr:hypothetical protein [Chlamydiia bacterium]